MKFIFKTIGKKPDVTCSSFHSGGNGKREINNINEQKKATVFINKRTKTTFETTLVGEESSYDLASDVDGIVLIEKYISTFWGDGGYRYYFRSCKSNIGKLSTFIAENLRSAGVNDDVVIEVRTWDDFADDVQKYLLA
jgi:hypothetical protein